MTYTLVVIFSFTIAIPAVIGGIRFNTIHPSYYCFIILIWLGLINETISYFVSNAGYPTVINNNIYFLLESLMITWQFKNWNLFRKSKYLFVGIMLTFLMGWALETLFIAGIRAPIMFFRIFYSFIVALMSVEMINREVMKERRNLLKNPIFLICIMFVITYAYAVILGAFWLYGLQFSQVFMMNLTAILIYLNLLTNLVFAIAVLWIPTRLPFSLLS